MLGQVVVQLVCGQVHEVGTVLLVGNISHCAVVALSQHLEFVMGGMDLEIFADFAIKRWF